MWLILHLTTPFHILMQYFNLCCQKLTFNYSLQCDIARDHCTLKKAWKSSPLSFFNKNIFLFLHQMEPKMFLNLNAVSKMGTIKNLNPFVKYSNKVAWIHVYLLVRHVPFIAKGAVRILLWAIWQHDESTDLFLRLKTICTHLSGSNLWNLKVLLPLICLNSFNFVHCSL